MPISLPTNPAGLMSLTWEDLSPAYESLITEPLDPTTVESWLQKWSDLASVIRDLEARLYVATSVNTADEEAEKRLYTFLDTIFQPAKAADEKLKARLLDLGVVPAGMEIPVRKMQADREIFREENLPLLAQEQKLGNEYDKLIGAQTVEWQGETLTLARLKPLLQSNDRDQRESVWKLASGRALSDRDALNGLWSKFLSLRMRVATNAGVGGDYRAYMWRAMHRFDYSPDDCAAFRDSIETVVVPAALRIYERRRQQLGVAQLRPWDLDVDPLQRSPLHPFAAGAELRDRPSEVFRRVDPALGAHYDTMRQHDLLDLENRPNKAPGGYCTEFVIERKPFIFMNAVGLDSDLRTMLHEAGHAFHVFESAHLPYVWQLDVPMEFAEVASMSMELLAAPYVLKSTGGFYSEEDAARSRVEHLEKMLLFWPYMAVVDGFQHWVYENAEAAVDAASCDAAWSLLWHRFMGGVSWEGHEAALATGWHRKLHIFQVPFYYIEYGLAQLGAIQVWRNSLTDANGAVAAYRKALSLGGSASLPDLFQSAGAKFSMDRETLRGAVELLEVTLAELGAG